ncbi:hypothetical protein [Granulicella aggregans]|jgi:hypothetical protein|uniref:hypothetical protein n=1 Tax=Granulicella aggregans TaxID=474949 RepID=UPI0021DFE91F|nr:hypothetical protein [Granulicella aggregans]
MRKKMCDVATAGAGQWKRSVRGRRVAGVVAVLAAVLMISGCHSAYVSATISNHGPTPISVVQVEYPSASFGTQTIAPGQEFKYRFKVLGSGTVKLAYTDAAQVEHKFTGPPLKEGDEGSLSVVAGVGDPRWSLSLRSR